MKKIKLITKQDKIIGAVRVTENLYNKIVKIAEKHNVSYAEVVRRIVEECIDDIEFE